MGTTVVHGDLLDDWLAERRRLGQDKYDEVWNGDYHAAPIERARNGRLALSLGVLLAPLARARDLVVLNPFNLGSGPTNFRVPDLGVVRRDISWDDDLYLPTAELVVEVLSPDDETWAKLPHYAALAVGEVWVVDPVARTVQMLQLAQGDYRVVGISLLVDLADREVEQALDWP